MELAMQENHQDTNDVSDDNKILVVASCGLDRLLTVPSYPEADAKIRTTSYCEVGGGNGSNSAHAMALLLGHHHEGRRHPLLSSRPLAIQLATKLGSDAVGTTLQEELEQAGVDLTSPLFLIQPDASTAFTTIIVTSGEDPTRTCLHTPGSCGELTLDDLGSVDTETLFQGVVHFHSDARHTDVALALARQAKQRGIPISLDVEKDRQTKALDQLLPLADIVFTNALQIESYLDRLDREMATSQGIDQDDELPTAVSDDYATKRADFFIHILKPSMFFTRWYKQVGKEVVITKGRQGSVHVRCDDVVEQSGDDGELNQMSLLRVNESSTRAMHKFRDRSSNTTVEATYTITTAGISQDLEWPLVDPTGAGDAFLGAYLVAQHVVADWDVSLRLRFAAWVAGRKLGGPGARRGLPSSLDVLERLGEDPRLKLESLVGSFCWEDDG